MLGRLLRFEGKQREMLTKQISLAGFELVNLAQQLLVRIIDKYNILASFLDVRCAEAQLLEETGAEKNILGIGKAIRFEPVMRRAGKGFIQPLKAIRLACCAVSQRSLLGLPPRTINGSLDDLHPALQFWSMRDHTNV